MSSSNTPQTMELEPLGTSCYAHTLPGQTEQWSHKLEDPEGGCSS